MLSEKRMIIFAGTTEGRLFSEALSRVGISHTVFVATEYGELVMEESPIVEIRRGRLSEDEMETLFNDAEDLVVFDATHPFATLVTENIKRAAEAAGAEYIRIKRDIGHAESSNIRYFDSVEECADALAESSGNILLTTGSKDLSKFTKSIGMAERVFARILPSEESISLASAAGLEGRHVIAMHGPFSKEMNKATIAEYDIDILVTKETGSTGGYPEKIDAARELGIKAYVIGAPSGDEGLGLRDAIKRYAGNSLDNSSPMRIYLIGIGPGGEGSITNKAQAVIDSSDVVFGAERMIKAFPTKRSYPYYLGKDVLPIILEEKPEMASILFSGDSGFFSGAKKMKDALLDGFVSSGLRDGTDFLIEILPGISSISYFSSKIGIDYSNAGLRSIHGRSGDSISYMMLLDELRSSGKVFTLLSGSDDIPEISKMLRDYGPSDARMIIGKNLSYEDEEILEIDLGADASDYSLGEGSYVAYIESANAIGGAVFPLLSDDEFERGKVPMTKEAVRHLSIARLELAKDSILYDIGSGTGSIAVQAAGLSDVIKVYAIEKKEEALDLIEINAKKHKRGNIKVVRGEAPEALMDLESPTHAFIGGSSGNLKEILAVLAEKNPKMRVVMNAVSLETISEITAAIKEFPVINLSIEQIQASRSRTLGNYHMMSAENPVMIASFNFGEDE